MRSSTELVWLPVTLSSRAIRSVGNVALRPFRLHLRNKELQTAQSQQVQEINSRIRDIAGEIPAEHVCSEETPATLPPEQREELKEQLLLRTLLRGGLFKGGRQDVLIEDGLLSEDDFGGPSKESTLRCFDRVGESVNHNVERLYGPAQDS